MRKCDPLTCEIKIELASFDRFFLLLFSASATFPQFLSLSEISRLNQKNLNDPSVHNLSGYVAPDSFFVAPNSKFLTANTLG